MDPTSSSFYKNEVDGISQLAVFFDNIPNKPGEIHYVKLEETETKPKFVALKNGSDGDKTDETGASPLFKPDDYVGIQRDLTDPFSGAVIGIERCGLVGMKAIEDISILCIPDQESVGNSGDLLIDHCEELKYRFAILQTKRSDIGNISNLVPDTESKYASSVLSVDKCV